MTMDGSAGRHLASEINITPMIDVLLVLLIIFMVIVPVVAKGEATSVPRSAPLVKVTEPDAVILEVSRDGTGHVAFTINRQSTPRAELPARLGDMFARRAQHVLFVKGDDQLSFRQVAEVIDIGHAAGADRVCLLTPKAANL